MMKLQSLLPGTILLMLASFTFYQCSDTSSDIYLHEFNKPSLPESPYNYSQQEMENAELNNLLKSKVSDHGATLGRVLFYDKILSKNNSVSCASCHKQTAGFADDKALSIGFNGKTTRRNSMSICNTLSSGLFFWDGRETSIDNLVLQPVKDHVEMGMEKMDVLVQKLEKAGYYEPLFKNAFGNASITPERIGLALGQFVNSMVSTNARAKDVEGNSWTPDITVPNTFTASEAEGARLFFGKARCGNCHVTNNSSFTILFSQQFADIGLDVNPTDIGAGELNPNQMGMFKIPSMDNIALTAPYMHDGRFASLDEVINHYNEKIQPSKNLSWELKDFEGNPVKLGLTESEKKDLKAFLLTFTDDAMLKDKKFSDPFRQ